MLEGSREDMELLAEYRTGMGTVSLREESLQYLEDFNKGLIHIICTQGFRNKGYKLQEGLSRTNPRTGGMENSIWIRPRPLYDPRSMRHIFFMDIDANDEQAIKVLHMVVSLIADAIIIAAEPEDSLSYLAGIAENVSDGVRQGYSTRVKNSNANLMILMPKLHPVTSEDFNDITEVALRKLSIEGVEDQTLKTHPLVKGYEVSEVALKNSLRPVEVTIIEEVELTSLIQKENSELMFGHILAQYLRSICDQVNKRKGKVDIKKAEEDIEIEQGFEAYMMGVNKYSQVSMSMLETNESPDNNELRDILWESRKKSVEEYINRGGASNVKFRKYLDDYVDEKEKSVLQTYSTSQLNRNLQILETESKLTLDKVHQRKMRSAPDANTQIQRQIDLMKQNYETQARGPEKYSTYNDFMRVFLPVIYEPDPAKRAQLLKLMKRNEELRRRRDELMKKQKKCCSLM